MPYFINTACRSTAYFAPRVTIGRFGGRPRGQPSIADSDSRMQAASRTGLTPFTATKVSINTFVQWIGHFSSG
jgi:hypothetical protein